MLYEVAYYFEFININVHSSDLQSGLVAGLL